MAAATTLRARKGVACLAGPGAAWAHNCPAPKAWQERRFIDTIWHEACDFFQPLSCPDSFLGQSASLRFVRHVLALRPDTAVLPTALALLHSILRTTDAEKILGFPKTVVVWMLVI